MREIVENLKKKTDQLSDFSHPKIVTGHSYLETMSIVFPILSAIDELEKNGMSRSDIIPYIKPVRESVRQSPFFKRMQDWPRGYQGDFETIEYLMAGINHAPKGTMAYHIEQYGLTSPAAQQHRNKVNRQSELILKKRGELKHFRCLSIACGSSSDLVKAQNLLHGRHNFTLYDYDREALKFSLSRLPRIRESCDIEQGNVLKIERDLGDRGFYDLVIVGGLFDYLKDAHIVRILHFVWTVLLEENGTVFFTNISPDNPDRILIEYFADWFLIARTEAQILELLTLAKIQEPYVHIERDTTNCTIMVGATKRSCRTQALYTEGSNPRRIHCT